MGDAVGLAWPRDDTLVVQEAVSRSTGGYAGLFDPSQGLVEVAYYADDEVVLHEAAHGWFNGSLLADRWANEAFASYYGRQAAKALKVPVTGNGLTEALKQVRHPAQCRGARSARNRAPSRTTLRRDARARGCDREARRSGWSPRCLGRCGGRAGVPAATSGARPRRGATGDGAERSRAAGLAGPSWICSRARAATYDDLWRTWVARDGTSPS